MVEGSEDSGGAWRLVVTRVLKFCYVTSRVFLGVKTADVH